MRLSPRAGARFPGRGRSVRSGTAGITARTTTRIRDRPHGRRRLRPMRPAHRTHRTLGPRPPRPRHRLHRPEPPVLQPCNGDAPKTDDTDLMRRLFDQAKDTGPAEAAIDRLIYCHLLERLTGGDMTVAMEQFADPGTAEAAMTELEALPDHERAHVAGRVSAMWNDALTRSAQAHDGSMPAARLQPRRPATRPTRPARIGAARRRRREHRPLNSEQAPTGSPSTRPPKRVLIALSAAPQFWGEISPYQVHRAQVRSVLRRRSRSLSTSHWRTP